MTTHDTPEAALAAALVDHFGPSHASCADDLLSHMPGWTLLSHDDIAADARRISDAQAEIARLTAALEQIVEYAPEWTDGDLPDHSDCAECARRRGQHWPPSEMCETLYSAVWRRDDRNRQREATQHYQMRDIARAALAPQEASE